MGGVKGHLVTVTVTPKLDWIGYGWYPGGVRYRALRGANNHQVHLQQEAYQGVAHIIIIFASKILKFWTPENDDNIMMADHLEIGYYKCI